MRPTRFPTDDVCDRAAIEAALACARDRAPRFERGEEGSGRVSFVHMTWVRLDSPKQEASLRVSCLGGAPVAAGDAEAMRALAETILAGALGDATDHTELLGWRDDLAALAMLAATLDETPDTRSVVDFCWATAGSP